MFAASSTASNLSKTERRFCSMVEEGCMKMKFSFSLKRSLTVPFRSFIFNIRHPKSVKSSIKHAELDFLRIYDFAKIFGRGRYHGNKRGPLPRRLR